MTTGRFPSSIVNTNIGSVFFVHVNSLHYNFISRCYLAEIFLLECESYSGFYIEFLSIFGCGILFYLTFFIHVVYLFYCRCLCPLYYSILYVILFFVPDHVSKVNLEMFILLSNDTQRKYTNLWSIKYKNSNRQHNCEPRLH